MNVMAAAWSEFSKVYHYPAVPFKSIGKKCFNTILKNMWTSYKYIKSNDLNALKAKLIEEKAALELSSDYLYSSIAGGSKTPRVVADLNRIQAMIDMKKKFEW